MYYVIAKPFGTKDKEHLETHLYRPILQNTCFQYYSTFWKLLRLLKRMILVWVTIVESFLSYPNIIAISLKWTHPTRALYISFEYIRQSFRFVVIKLLLWMMLFSSLLFLCRKSAIRSNSVLSQQKARLIIIIFLFLYTTNQL